MKRAVLIALLLAPLTGLAQVGSTDPFTLTVTPTYPRPNAPILLTPQSTQLDLANSTMSVTLNGASIYSGATKAVGVTLGGPASTNSIRVSITAKGQTSSMTLSLKPQGVALVAEPIASAPPLYAGKPLVPAAGTVRVVAMADLRTSPTGRTDPAALSYTWTVNDQTLASASGIGRTSIVLATPLPYRSEEVSVVVQTRDGSVMSGDTLVVSSQTPMVRIYASDPLLGVVFDHALSGSYAIMGAEANFFAAPYSFSLAHGAPTVRWFLNGTAAQTGQEITLRPEGDGQGSASLSATASGAGSDETTSSNLSVRFGASISNLFGL